MVKYIKDGRLAPPSFTSIAITKYNYDVNAWFRGRQNSYEMKGDFGLQSPKIYLSFHNSVSKNRRYDANIYTRELIAYGKCERRYEFTKSNTIWFDALSKHVTFS